VVAVQVLVQVHLAEHHQVELEDQVAVELEEICQLELEQQELQTLAVVLVAVLNQVELGQQVDQV
jgi:ABC-type proline/glycine betaine transport system permease subunit